MQDQITRLFFGVFILVLSGACTSLLQSSPPAPRQEPQPVRPAAALQTPQPEPAAPTPAVPSAAVPEPGASATASGSGTAVPAAPAGPAEATSLEIVSAAAALPAGGSLQLSVLLRDGSGQVLNLAPALEWSSSQPQDISVDAGGVLRALDDTGFADISVKIRGTGLSAHKVFNITRPASGGGGGGGGGSGGGGGGDGPTPQEDVSGEAAFEF
ncbi:MAG: hypothetical protein ACAI44_37755 [Candidatus Sericytochromatia bacterium]